jgi:hypothetical protein
MRLDAGHRGRTKELWFSGAEIESQPI